MPGGQFDSSRTRVAPLFHALRQRGADWTRELLTLASGGAPNIVPEFDGDFSLIDGFWHPHERGLDPPVSLLSWLIRNVQELPDELLEGKRRGLVDRDPAVVEEALRALRSNYSQRDWFIFEGRTYPDALLVTKTALVVIEGKRTEAGPTTTTKWLPGRHQLWRHIDAAWEIRGRRAVFGLLIVEGTGEGDEVRTVPELWRAAARASCDSTALETSFPHRSATEARAICSCFLGVTTWQAICHRFGLDWAVLPGHVP